jgi:hypothetical protein
VGSSRITENSVWVPSALGPIQTVPAGVGGDDAADVAAGDADADLLGPEVDVDGVTAVDDVLTASAVSRSARLRQCLVASLAPLRP